MGKGGTTCSVFSCKNTSENAKNAGKILTFHQFPRNPDLRKCWVDRCYRHKTFSPRGKKMICSEHFKEEDYEDERKAKMLGVRPKRLKAIAFPSRNLSPSVYENQNTGNPPERNLETDKNQLENIINTKSSSTKENTICDFPNDSENNSTDLQYVVEVKNSVIKQEELN